MSETQVLLRTFRQIYDNPILLEQSVTAIVCEGLNIALASFSALYLQYQKHHFVVEGALLNNGMIWGRFPTYNSTSESSN